MSLRNLVRKFTPSLRLAAGGGPLTHRSSTARRRGLRIESLEARQMLTINYILTGAGADLSISPPNAGATAQAITIDFDGTTYTFAATSGGPFDAVSDPGNLVTGNGTNTISVAAASFSDLYIDLANGNDSIAFNTDGPSGYPNPMSLSGSSGADTLNVNVGGGAVFQHQVVWDGWDTINLNQDVTVTRGANTLISGTFNALQVVQGITPPADTAVTINLAQDVDIRAHAGGIGFNNSSTTNLLLQGAAGTNVISADGSNSNGDASIQIGGATASGNAALTGQSDGFLFFGGDIDINGALSITVDADNDETINLSTSNAITAGSVTVIGGSNDTWQPSGTVLATNANAGIVAQTIQLDFGSTLSIPIGSTTPGSGFPQYRATTLASLTGTTLAVSLVGGFMPATNSTFRIIDKTSAGAVTGTFTGLAEGAGITVGTTTFTISYVGGDGNDVVLTAAPPPPDMTFVISGTTLTITDTATRNNNIAVSFDGTNLVFDDPNATVDVATGGSAAGTVSNANHRLTLPLASGAGGANLTQINVNTAAGNDTLTIDQGATAAGRLPLNVTYNGGVGGDDGLAFQGGGTFNTAIYNYTGPHSGDVRMDPDGPGGAVERVFTYSEIEPLANAGTATNVVFNLPGTSDNVQLSDLGGMFRLESTNATFEVTDFVPPAPGGTLVINMAGGNDDIAVLAVPTGVTTTINGDAGDDTFRPQAAALAFSANGGADNDTLVLATTASITGSFDGGAGASDAINFATITGARSITLTALGATDGFNGTETSIGGGFSNVNSITGSAATDSLTNALVPAATATWEIDGTNRFQSGGRDLAFSAFENLSGGSLADTFTVTAAHTGNLTGNGGNDIFNVTGVLVTGNLSGNAGDDTFNFGGAADVTGTIDGGTGGLDTMTLAGAATNVAHTFNNANDGQVNIDGRTLDYLGLDPIADNLSAVNRIFTFAGVTGDDITLGDDGVVANGVSRISSVSSSETVDFVNPTGSLTVNAGVGNDIVAVNSMDGFGGMPTVTINGGAGDDDITVNALPTAAGNVVNGDADSDTIRVGAVLLSFTANGGTQTDTLVGPNATTTWNATGGGAGNIVTGPTFATMENLTGRDFVDTFNISGNHTGNILGGGGDDLFNLSGAAVVTGTINGGAGANDRLSYAGYASARSFSLTGLGAVDGFDGTEASITGGFSNVNAITGSPLTDSLSNNLMPATAAQWEIDGTNRFLASTRELAFSAIENLNGGSLVDIFDVTASHTGNLTGNSGNDAFNIANAVTLTGNVSGGVGLDELNLTGTGMVTGSFDGGGDFDTLSGGNIPNIWTVNAANTGLMSSVGGGFTNVEILVGGSLADIFNFTGAGTLAGSLDGRGGTDRLNYSGYGSARNVTLSALGGIDGFDGTEASIAAGFRNINELVGTTAFVDSLTGLNAASTWNVAVSKTYVSTNTLTFADIETLSGGSAADTFNVAGANIESGEANTLNGNGGEDTFNLIIPSNGGLVAAVGTTLAINGGVQPAGTRDTVNIDATADTIARVLDIRYVSAASGDVDILDIGTASPTGVDVNTVEEVNYTGDAGNDDSVLVRGTAGDDDLTVRPLSASAADVFLGGAFINSVPNGTPGIDGGSTGPDVSLAGMLPTGLSVNGNGGSDGLTVQTPAGAQEITVTNVVVAPSMLVETRYTAIGETLNIVTAAGDDMVMIDLPDVAGGAGAVTPGVDPNGPLPDFLRVLSDGGNDVVKFMDVDADQDHNTINFADLDPLALAPAVATETAFQLAATECSLVLAGAGNDVVRNLTLLANAGFSTNSVMDLADGNDIAFGSNNGRKVFGVGDPPHGDVIYGGAGIDNITAGTMGVKFLFADFDVADVDHPMAGDVLDGSFNNQVNISAGAGDFINNLVGGFFGSGSILNVVTWLKAQWRMGTGVGDAQAAKCANWHTMYNGTGLGTIAAQSIADLNTTAADAWYDFHAAASGILTASATFAPGENVEIKVFDEHFAPVAWEFSNDGSAVAQTPVVAGSEYYVRVRGLTTNVDLDLTIADPNVLPPTVTALTLGSSSGADWFTPSVGSGVQLASTPWARDQIRVTFSEDVLVSAGDLFVSGVSVLNYGVLPGAAGFQYDAATHSATWTLATPIANDKVIVTLSDGIRDASGNALDGEWNNPLAHDAAISSAFPSGNSTPGGSFQLRLNVLDGDVNGDGIVNLIDVAQTRDAMSLGLANAFADVTRDGAVTVADVRHVANQMFRHAMLPSGEPVSSVPSPAAPQAPAALVVDLGSAGASATEPTATRRIAAATVASEGVTRSTLRRRAATDVDGLASSTPARRRISVPGVDAAIAGSDAALDVFGTPARRRLRRP
ncbi:MAG: dockerin type I domain-containing protein [Pirellulales bacterium]